MILVLKTVGKAFLVLALILLLLIAAVMVFLKTWPGVGRTPDAAAVREYETRSPNWRGGQFRNETDMGLSMGERGEGSPNVRPSTAIPVVKNETVPAPEAGKLFVTWYGHSTAQVQIGEKNVLIDPVLSEICSPVSFVGVRRYSPLALEKENVPEIDLCFISHDHYDHLDRPTVMAIDGRVKRYLVPLGVDVILAGWGIERERISVLDWWDETDVDGLKCTLTPGQHFSGRNPLRRNATLWGGLYFTDGQYSVYYTGDGGYSGAFARVGERLGPPDLMLTETGQYNVAWKSVHMAPEESVQAAADAGARQVIPVHWGAFVLADHAWNDPAVRSVAAAERLGVSLAVPMIGQRVELTELPTCTDPWWDNIT